MPLTVSSLETSPEGFTLLLTGPSGVGKTSFALGRVHPDMKPAIVLNTDKGLSSIIDPQNNDGIQQVQADNISDFMVIQKFAALSDTHPQKPAWMRGVHTVIWDSLTSFVDESVMENAASPDSDTISLYQAGRRDYLISQGQALSLFDNLKRQRYNQVVIAGTSEKENKQGIALPPGLTERIVYRFSYIMRQMVVQNQKTGDNSHVLVTRPRGVRDIIKVRNSRFRARLDAESDARLRAAGWNVGPEQRGFLLLSDPLNPNPPDYQISLTDLYQWYKEEVLDI